MPYRRSRPRIATGFAPGGRANLIDSLTTSADELRQKQLAQQTEDRSKLSAFNRGDISYAELEAYLGSRIAEEKDPVWKSQLSDSLSTAKFANQQGSDKAKVSAWRSGAISFKELEQYLQGRLAKPLNGNDAQQLSDALASFRSENNQKTDSSNLTKWKSGQMSNADFKAYLQSRLASSSTDEDKANLQAAIKGVDTKVRQDQDSTMAAKYKTDGNIKTYTDYLTSQAARKDITPEEQAGYEQVRETTLTAYNQAQDNRVYYEYIQGTRSAESAQKYFNDRLSTAKPLEADNIQQRIAQVTQAEDARLKAAQQAAARGASNAQSQLNALVEHKVAFAKQSLEEHIKESSLIADPRQRAQAIVDAYNAYGNVLEAASQTGARYASEYIYELGPNRGNLAKQAQLDVQKLVGGQQADSAIKMNGQQLQAAGSDATRNAGAIAAAITRAREAINSPFLSPDRRDELTQHLQSLEQQLHGHLGDQVTKRDGLAADLQDLRAQAAEYTKTKQPVPDSLQLRIANKQRDLNQLETGRQALYQDLNLFGYQRSAGGEGYSPYGSPTAQQDARENLQHGNTERLASQPAPAQNGFDLGSLFSGTGNLVNYDQQKAGAYAGADKPLFTQAGGLSGLLSNIVNAFSPPQPVPQGMGPADFASASQRANEFVPPDSADQQNGADTFVDPYAHQSPDTALRNIDLSNLDFKLPSTPGAAFAGDTQDLKDQSNDTFGRFNRAITEL